jgi:hypothetical protein
MNGSRVTVLITGGLTVAMGAVGILSGLGYLPKGQDDPTVPMAQQQALAICIGTVFAAGGLAAMLNGLPGRAARLANQALGLIVAFGLTVLLGWVAVGPGSRGFSSPVAILGPRVNDISGRIMFGLGAAMGLAILVLMIRGVRRGRDKPVSPSA